MVNMPAQSVESLFQELADGRTDRVFELLQHKCSSDMKDQNGVSLMQWCAYYGDVSAMKYLIANGAALDSLGQDLGLNAASFHGHWRLCQFLIEQGADVNQPDSDTGETPLHSALCSSDRVAHDLVVKVLLDHGANVNASTRKDAETGAFMRDSRTKGETPLHRAAAFGSEETIKMLLDAGARLETRDAYGDSPLGWASWHQRPAPILRMLCFGDFRISPRNRPMRTNLQGTPHEPGSGAEKTNGNS
jgi:ankyrin repeat protein